MYICNRTQEQKGTAILLRDLELQLAENPRVKMGELSSQQPPLTDHLNSTDTVKQFCGVIGENGELVHDGHFVELDSPHHGVGI